MIEPSNGQALSHTQKTRPRYTGERLLRERPKIYRQVVRLLGEGWSANKICGWCHVTRETVRAVECREAADISVRKKSIIGILGNVAELGAGRMEETISKAGLRDAAIGTGVAVDKILALTDQTPAVQIANIVLPTDEERAERRLFTIGWTPSHGNLQSRASPAPSILRTRVISSPKRRFYFSCSG